MVLIVFSWGDIAFFALVLCWSSLVQWPMTDGQMHWEPMNCWLPETDDQQGPTRTALNFLIVILQWSEMWHLYLHQYTACGHRMAHRKRKETKQQPSLLPGPAVPGCSLISFYFLWAILCPQAVEVNFVSFNIPKLFRIHSSFHPVSFVVFGSTDEKLSRKEETMNSDKYSLRT